MKSLALADRVVLGFGSSRPWVLRCPIQAQRPNIFGNSTLQLVLVVLKLDWTRTLEALAGVCPRLK